MQLARRKHNPPLSSQEMLHVLMKGIQILASYER